MERERLVPLIRLCSYNDFELYMQFVANSSLKGTDW